MINEIHESSTYNSKNNSAPSQSLISRDRNYNELLVLAETVAKSKATVLILGEFGAGKRTLAKFIHERSTRAQKQLLVLNCREVALGDQEATFDSLIKQALGSTLLMAEIWKLNPQVQLKLFQVLQEGLDVRLIATSSRSLANLVKNGEFREDLYYRLNVVNLKIPSLQERIGDIEYLANQFVSKWGLLHGRPGMRLSEEAIMLLNSHRFAGNIRELESTCERAVLLAPNLEVRARDIQLQQVSETRQSQDSGGFSWKPGRTLDELERNVILEALKHFSGNRTHTAKSLGISIRTLRNKLAEYRVMGIKA
jgi:two-component system response regulator FlrC